MLQPMRIHRRNRYGIADFRMRIADLAIRNPPSEIRNYRRLLALAMLVMIFSSNASAQTTAFTYQGRLADNGAPANGQYNFQFKLFDTATIGTGTQVGGTLTMPTVQVSAGTFTVQLDFGVAAFPGAARFLEIAVKQTSGSTFTTLSPRQPINSTPYAVRSLAASTADTATNATQLGGLAASNFIQNTTAQQAATNFNIGGTGTANILEATTQFSLGGNRILSNAGTQNLFAGVGAGILNTGSGNSFFGADAGASNTSGISNSFFGRSAGTANTTGSANSFFGASGTSNTTGFFNSFYGHNSGVANTTGSNNAFFGAQAGQGNFEGSNNVFVGFDAGHTNGTGSNLTLLGANTAVLADPLNFATAIGAGAIVNSSNTVVLGRNADTVKVPGVLSVTGTTSGSILNATGQFNFNGNRVLTVNGPSVNPTSNIFVGVNAGNTSTTGAGNSFVGNFSGQGNTTGSSNSFFGSGTGQVNTSGNSNSFFGSSAGNANTTGDSNSFFGVAAGLRNTTGRANAFFGLNAGVQNTTGSNNDFFGNGAGAQNTIGQFNAFFGDRAGILNTASNNSFFGNQAGLSNTSGASNSFFGDNSGANNATGGQNAFFGNSAGAANTSGSNNTVIGAFANVGANNLDHATVIGAGAVANTNNTVVLGRSADTVQIPGALNTTGINTTGIINANILNAATQFNIGGAHVLSAPGIQNIFVGGSAGSSNTTGAENTFIGFNAGNPDASTQVSNSVAIGAFATVSTSNTIVLGTSSQTTSIPGSVVMGNTAAHPLTGGGVAEVFSNGSIAGILTGTIVLSQINSILASPVHACIRTTSLGGGFGGESLARCTTALSSVDNKTDVHPYAGGLALINRLKPVTFKWKAGGDSDFGLNAEDVAEVEPLLVTRNDKGAVEDVKHESMLAVIINAFKEEQEQIKQQQLEIESLKKRLQELDALKGLVCANHPGATVCKAN